jgi:predicted GNAT family acetyltransferase
MVVSVMTRPGYRGRGYATACVSRLCADLLREGKRVCLLYNNPAAARIYRRLGFGDIGDWLVLRRSAGGGD